MLESQGEDRFVYRESIPLTLHHIEETSVYHQRRFELTGSEEFVTAMGGIASASDDDEIFKASGLPYVIPEMREDKEVFDRVVDRDEYVTNDDLRGIVHNHSTYSDGLNSLRGDGGIRARQRLRLLWYQRPFEDCGLCEWTFGRTGHAAA